MQASTILGVCQSTLDDPSANFWTVAELLSYLNQYVAFACGLKPDLYPVREVVNLAAGVDQALPTGGMQFMDADYTGNGQAVFIRTLEQVKHSKFANMASVTPVADVQVVVADPRDPKRYYVFPPASGGSACSLQIRYGAIPDPLVAQTDTYPLPTETSDSAYRYVLSLAYRKSTDRQDLEKAGIYYQQSMDWFMARTKTQLSEDAVED